MRMLEREFTPRRSRQRDVEDQPEPEEERVIGSVDARGDLITAGPKKRLTLRIVQTMLAFGAGAAGIYAALLIKPNPPAPPAGSIPAILLDVLSVITFLGLLYILVFRRCCVRNKGPSNAQAGGLGMPGMPGGVMVLPVHQGGKKPKKKKHKKGMPMQGDVQVNLIVDPSTFMQQPQRSRRRGGYSELSGDMDSDDDRPAPPRRSVFHGMALEQAWLRARTYTKRLVAFDIIASLAWIGAFIYASFVGDNCPPGKYQGWCDAYNLSLAGAALIFLCFVASAFFNIRDLRMSSQSPRTRT